MKKKKGFILVDSTVLASFMRFIVEIRKFRGFGLQAGSS